MTNTTVPTDAEIIELEAAHTKRHELRDCSGYYSEFDIVSFARAVLARWGAPAPASDVLEKAVRKMYAAKGRHHSQIATCDLYDLLGLPNVRPGQEAPPAPASVEPFGYFRAEPFGWTDCAPTDEGAIALYEKPPAPEVRAPLSDDQIEAARKKAFSTDNPFCPVDRKSMLKAARAIERAHGITEKEPK